MAMKLETNLPFKPVDRDQVIKDLLYLAAYLAQGATLHAVCRSASTDKNDQPIHSLTVYYGGEKDS
jgi:hypothetical protein